jgi:hypothetical protein
MKTPSVRDRLVGKPLIGFDTRPGAVRAPNVRAGGNTEVKPKA